jgi:hypothetical protein
MGLVFHQSIGSELQEMRSIIQQEKENKYGLKPRIHLSKHKIHHGDLCSITYHIETAAEPRVLVEHPGNLAIDSIKYDSTEIVCDEIHPHLFEEGIVHALNGQIISQIIYNVGIVSENVPMFYILLNDRFIIFETITCLWDNGLVFHFCYSYRQNS